MDIIEEINQTLKEQKLIKNDDDFSSCWLHKSDRYYSMIKSTGRDISFEALSTLAMRLKQLCERMEQQGFKNKQQQLIRVKQLTEALLQKLEERALTRRPRKRLIVAKKAP